MSHQLNQRASELCSAAEQQSDRLGIAPQRSDSCALILDFGIEASGGLSAGITLSEICLSGLGSVSIVSGTLDGKNWPHVAVQTDHPVAACLLSQYAGWQIATDDFFAMGSGPMRATACVEDLFEHLNYRETAETVVGVLETRKFPTAAAIDLIAPKCSVAPDNVILCTAPTASLAGVIQIAARSVETAVHKLHELGFDIASIVAGYGTAPLPPIGNDDLAAMGTSNDAILYGGQVQFWVDCDDSSIDDIGPRVPSCSSDSFGQSFLELFEAADRDFYQMDPLLFSPAEVVFQNVSTGTVQRFGGRDDSVLKRSFGCTL